MRNRNHTAVVFSISVPNLAGDSGAGPGESGRRGDRLKTTASNEDGEMGTRLSWSINLTYKIRHRQKSLEWRLRNNFTVYPGSFLRRGQRYPLQDEARKAWIRSAPK